MNELVILNNSGVPVTTSRKVAETFDKMHKNIIQGIKQLDCSDDFYEQNFHQTTYLDNYNRNMTEYLMTKDGFAFLVMGFTGRKAGLFKESYIKEFNRREKEIAMSKVMQGVPTNFIEAMRLALKQAEEKEELSRELSLARPKVDYYDQVLRSETGHTTTVIAKELGTTAPALNRFLHDEGIQFKIGKTWVLYAKYGDKGWMKSRTVPLKGKDDEGLDSDRTVIQNLWTEAGREFIHELWKKKKTTLLIES